MCGLSFIVEFLWNLHIVYICLLIRSPASHLCYPCCSVVPICDIGYRISVIMLVIKFLLFSLYTPLIRTIVYSVNGAKLFWLWKTYLGNYENDKIKPLGQILKWWMWSPGKKCFWWFTCAPLVSYSLKFFLVVKFIGAISLFMSYVKSVIVNRRG